MPQLHAQFAQFDVKINDDSGSGAHQDLATWKPRLEPGWFYLGPAANNGDPRGRNGIIVQSANDSDTPALVPITRWERVWSDAGSGNPTDYSLWKGFPAPEDELHYVAVGGFFTRHSNPSGPSGDESDGMVAVHRDCLVEVSTGLRIWDDAGTGARQDGSVWEISADGYVQAVGTGAFLPADGHNNPPVNAYALDRKTIVE